MTFEIFIGVYLAVAVIGGVAVSFLTGYRRWRDLNTEMVVFCLMLWPFIPFAAALFAVVWALFCAPALLGKRLRGDDQ